MKSLRFNNPTDFIIDGSSPSDPHLGSVITVRPPSGSNTNGLDPSDAALAHPQVTIKNFTITGGSGTLMENRRLENQGSTQGKWIGSGLLAYLTIPEVENCIFIHNGIYDNVPSQVLQSGTVCAVDDPIVIIYPS